MVNLPNLSPLPIPPPIIEDPLHPLSPAFVTDFLSLDKYLHAPTPSLWDMLPEWVLDLLGEIFHVVPGFGGYELGVQFGSHDPYSLD